MMAETKTAERHEDTQPVFMMGGGGLVIERTDEPETLADDEKQAHAERQSVDEKAKPARTQSLSGEAKSKPTRKMTLAAAAEPARKLTRKMTLPPPKEWRKSRSLMCLVLLVLVSPVGHECTHFVALISLQIYVVLTACQGEL